MKNKTKKILANMLGAVALTGGAVAGTTGINKYYEDTKDAREEKRMAEVLEDMKEDQEAFDSAIKELMQAKNSSEASNQSSDVNENTHSDDDVMER